ncbi:pyridoxal phosphate-dependent aminotransferase [Algoriphagus namhaensis]
MKGFADRVSGVSEYYFSQKLREVAALISEGKPVLNLGIGSPDLSPPTEVIQALKSTADNAQAHGYQNYQGTPELRTAMMNYYQNFFGVSLNPQEQILPLMGSKEGIMHLSMAFLNPGDEVLIPDPGYPTYTAVTELLEATPKYYALDLNRKGRPDLEHLQSQDLTRVKIMWVNYPHMPTGAEGSEEIFSEIVAFGKKNDILILHDNPYTHLLTERPRSILEIPGAEEVAMELNSLSKSYNIPGWRIGMLVGKASFIQAVLKIKSNMDSGMFLGLQKGAIAALNLHKTWFEDLNEAYKNRKKLVCLLADELGLTYAKDSSGLFLWGKVPAEQDADELVNRLLQEHYIFITPGRIFGEQGKDYVRLSLCLPEFKLLEAINRIKKSKQK